jgi:hypothetical protein
MVDMPIKLSAVGIALMLTYLLGDELRIYSGDIAPGKNGKCTVLTVWYAWNWS